jgi:anti-sigma regulatory factor (Ser/Thr protein kinase)
MYEAELNAVIHAGGGRAEVEIHPDHIQIKVIDNGPGIPDVGLAMQEGWSTAPDIAEKWASELVWDYQILRRILMI